MATTVFRYFVLWLLGMSLRVTQFALPPLIPDIRASLGFGAAVIAVLGALPILLFAAGAVAGSLIISRYGVARAVVSGLVAVAAFSALRGLSGSATLLFAGTVGMGLGIAVLQPSMPVLVSVWMPDRIGAATAVYTNGLFVGQTLGAGLTLPLMMPLAGGNWRAAIAAWSVPVAVTTVLFAVSAGTVAGQSAKLERAFPDWRDRRTWQIGLLMGSGVSVTFAANLFLPDFLIATARGELVVPALTTMSLVQVLVPVAVLAFPHTLIGRRTPLLVAGVGLFAAALWTTVSSGTEVIVLAGVLGFLSAFILALCVALPPWLARPDAVHHVSAGMFAVAYGCAAVYPVVGGGAADLAGNAAVALVPNVAGVLVLIAMAAVVDLRRRPSER